LLLDDSREYRPLVDKHMIASAVTIAIKQQGSLVNTIYCSWIFDIRRQFFAKYIKI